MVFKLWEMLSNRRLNDYAFLKFQKLPSGGGLNPRPNGLQRLEVRPSTPACDMFELLSSASIQAFTNKKMLTVGLSLSSLAKF